MKIAIYSHSIAPSIDGVCRRFTGILREFCQPQSAESLSHEIVLFTLEDDPQDIPTNLLACITLDYMIFPLYPKKKCARPNLDNFLKILRALDIHRPQVRRNSSSVDC
jgi:hypothetical protein